MYTIYFYDNDDNVIDSYNTPDKDTALSFYNSNIKRFKCPNFYGKRKGKKVKAIEFTINGVPYDFEKF